MMSCDFRSAAAQSQAQIYGTARRHSQQHTHARGYGTRSAEKMLQPRARLDSMEKLY